MRMMLHDVTLPRQRLALRIVTKNGRCHQRSVVPVYVSALICIYLNNLYVINQINQTKAQTQIRMMVSKVLVYKNFSQM